jgi:hypothetical protein
MQAGAGGSGPESGGSAGGSGGARGGASATGGESSGGTIATAGTRSAGGSHSAGAAGTDGGVAGGDSAGGGANGGVAGDDSAGGSSSGGAGATAGTSSTRGGAAGAGGSSVGTAGSASQPWFCTEDTWPATDMGSGQYSVDTPHYHLTLAVPSSSVAEDMAKMAEVAWAAESSYFGAAPELASGERLSVAVYASYDAWVAAMLADGVTTPGGGGGYYAPSNHKAYAYRQPTEYFTRCLFLHELTHQFHWLARTHNNSPGPSWYTEGLAESLSRHDWDGKCLRLGALPLLSQDDYFASASSQVSADTFDLASALPSAGRDLSLAFYRFLDQGNQGAYQSDFAEFRATMDDNGSADWSAELAEHVAQPTALEAPFASWLQIEQQPMEPVFVDWVHVKPGVIRSYSVGDYVFSLARLKEPVSHFEVTVPVPAQGSWWAGVVVAFEDPDNWVGYLAGPGQLTVARRAGGGIGWDWVADLPTPPSGGSHAWAVDYEGDTAFVTVNGVAVTETTDVALAGGVVVNGSNLSFEGMNWE